MLFSFSIFQDFFFWGGGGIPFPSILLPFYTSIFFPFNVHVSVSLSGVETYPISPYLEWLGAVVKVEQHDEEHGLVRHRVLYYSIGNFFICPASALSSSFPSDILWGAEHKIVFGQILRPFFGLSLCVLGNCFPRLRLWALMQSGLGSQILQPHISILFFFIYNRTTITIFHSFINPC